MVERSAVNRRVPGSSPGRGAIPYSVTLVLPAAGNSQFRGIGKQDVHRRNTLTDGTRWSRCVLLPGRLILNHREGRHRGHELLYAYAVKEHRRLIAVAFEDRAPTVPEMADRLAGL